MADFCSLRAAIFGNKSRRIFSIAGLPVFFFFFFPELVSWVFIAAAIFGLLCGFLWLLQNLEIGYLEENPNGDPEEFGGDERLKEFLVGDYEKAEVISRSINGGNQALQTQCRSWIPDVDRLEEYPCERGEKYEDPGEFFCEFGGVKRSEGLIVADHRKTEFVSRSINGGNQTLQAQRRSHPPAIGRLEEHPCERGEKHEDPDGCFREFVEVKRPEEQTVSDHGKTELASSSINGGNQTQHQTHPPVALGPKRREKEWSRTLAGKLREPGGGAGEEMDLLWEAYEKTEENRGGRRESSGEKKKTKKSKKNRIVDYLEDFDDEEVGNPQICCLKALKLSAGKMNFGMSKSGLLKISKSIRGIETGWLRRKKKRF